MSLFSNTSGVIIQGGTFYSAAGDVTIQNNQQLGIETSETHLALDQGSIRIWEGYPEGGSLSGPVRSNRTRAEAERYLPYDIGSRSTQYRSYPSECPTTTAAFDSGSDSSNSYVGREGSIEPASLLGIALNPRIGAAGGFLGSAAHYPCLSELPSTSTSSSTSLFAPGTHLADNFVPPSIYSPVAVDGPMLPPSTINQYLVAKNIHYGGYHTPRGTIGEGYYIAPDASLPGAPAAQVGAHASWQNAHPAQYEPTTTIHNGTFIGGNVNNDVRNGESGINILHRISAAEAFHDPADSHAQPRCHPETRIEMQEKLWKWCINSEWSSKELKTDSYDIEPTILWVHGPAGAGKSAIMETLSQRLEKVGRLGGTFFFKRGHPTRGNAKVLFTTIALQLAVNSSQLKLRISRTVEENPTLVGRSIGVQIRELILKPCLGLEDLPWVIIIDGLDECEGQNVQQHILRLIRDSTQPPTPLRFLIASRPEAHIREVFDELSFNGLYRGFNVEKSFDDVRTYLVAEFARIHREHSTMTAVQKPWPSEEVIDHLVWKSSGYFIYASTVIKFVDDKYFRPTERLGAITRSGFQSPLGALDDLYIQILSAVPKNFQLVPILRVIGYLGPALSPPQIDKFLGLESGDATLCLRGLHSVLESGRNVKPWFAHASFGDFLGDPSRAGEFYTGDSAALVEMARLVLTELGYMYEEPMKNLNRLLPGALTSVDQQITCLLRLVEPSQELVPLLRAINYDFIDTDDVDGILLWIERIQPPPEDLVRVWQDHHFIILLMPCEHVCTPLSLSLWRQISGQVMQQVVQCPLLLLIAGAMLWNEIVSLTDIRHLLDVSWDEVRATLCRLRPILHDWLEVAELCEFPALLIHDWMTKQQRTWRANICIQLAWGCIQVQKLINTGRLPKELWPCRIFWGRFIRASPACPQLLRGVQEFVPPLIPPDYHHLHQECECHDVIMWLKGFPEPPLDEIRRWQNLFWNERTAASERPSYAPPDDYEERWRRWEEEYPEIP